MPVVARSRFMHVSQACHFKTNQVHVGRGLAELEIRNKQKLTSFGQNMYALEHKLYYLISFVTPRNTHFDARRKSPKESACLHPSLAHGAGCI